MSRKWCGGPVGLMRAVIGSGLWLTETSTYLPTISQCGVVKPSSWTKCGWKSASLGSGGSRGPRSTQLGPTLATQGRLQLSSRLGWLRLAITVRGWPRVSGAFKWLFDLFYFELENPSTYLCHWNATESFGLNAVKCTGLRHSLESHSLCLIEIASLQTMLVMLFPNFYFISFYRTRMSKHN